MVTVAAMDALRSDGYAFASMGIVPMFDPDGRRADRTTGRAARWCIERFDRLFRFSGLQQFRSKFVPTHIEAAHVLHWPRLLTPFVALDIASVLAPRRGRV